MHNLEFVVAGYAITGGALALYVASLLSRARRARRRAEAVAASAGRHPRTQQP